jgi:tripartite-type tricarboxylate transporter receptor subunit TctC
VNRISSWRWIRLAGVPILVTALTLSVAGWSSAADPAKFPIKPVTIIVPAAAGGVNDTLCRTIAESMKKYFPKPVVVVNKAGAGGIAGTVEFLSSPADGYTLESGSFGWSVLPTHLQIPPPYTVDQAVPVIQFTSAPSTLAVQASAPWKNMKELIDYARANPGKIRLGHAGAGTYTHLVPVEFSDMQGIKFTMVPFVGSAPTVVALMGGNIEVASIYPNDAAPQVKAGQVRVLAVFSEKRVKAMPDAPTLKEQGIDLVRACGFPVMVPKGTPVAIIKVLHDAIKKASEDPAFISRMESLGYDLKYYNTEDAQKLLLEWHKNSGAVIQKLGLAKKQ